MDNKIPAEYLGKKFKYLTIHQNTKYNKWSVYLTHAPEEPKEITERLTEIETIYSGDSILYTKDYPNCALELRETLDSANCLIISKIEECPNLKYSRQLEEYKTNIKIYNEEKLIYDELYSLQENIKNAILKDMCRAQYEELKKEFENA